VGIVVAKLVGTFVMNAPNARLFDAPVHSFDPAVGPKGSAFVVRDFQVVLYNTLGEQKWPASNEPPVSNRLQKGCSHPSPSRFVIKFDSFSLSLQ